MNTHLTRRAVMGAALSAMAIPAVTGAQEKISAPKSKPATDSAAASAPGAGAAAAPATKGMLTEHNMPMLFKAMGIEVKASEQRYDFAFKSTIEEMEWEFSMSAVLSQTGSSIWIMAWLDELPKSAADVPRTALLRLLSDNDKLGKGKFFAYISANRRFVLQRVLPNENITTVAFRAALDDLGQSVASTHSHWFTANWTSSNGEDPANAARTGPQVKGSAPQPSGSTSQTQQPVKPTQSAVNDSKFNSGGKK